MALEEFKDSKLGALWDFQISDKIMSPVMRRLTGLA